jgi:hypothetical protein
MPPPARGALSDWCDFHFHTIVEYLHSVNDDETWGQITEALNFKPDDAALLNYTYGDEAWEIDVVQAAVRRALALHLIKH